MTRISKVETILAMLQTEPDDIFLNYSLGLEYVADFNFKKAEESFEKVIELKTDYISAYYQIGKLYESEQKIQPALNFFKRGLEFAKQQKNNKAVNEFNEAIFILED